MPQLSDEWGTPDSIFRLIPSGEYFDPCPSHDQPVRHARFYDGHNVSIYCREKPIRNPLFSGLEIAWSSKNFVNPPFSDPEPWIKKGLDLFFEHATQSIIVLPDFTDRKWWRRTVQPSRVPVVFIGRHKFIPLLGQKESQPRFGTSLLCIGVSNQEVQRMITSVRPK